MNNGQVISGNKIYKNNRPNAILPGPQIIAAAWTVWWGMIIFLAGPESRSRERRFVDKTVNTRLGPLSTCWRYLGKPGFGALRTRVFPPTLFSIHNTSHGYRDSSGVLQPPTKTLYILEHISRLQPLPSYVSTLCTECAALRCIFYYPYGERAYSSRLTHIQWDLVTVAQTASLHFRSRSSLR